MGDGAEHPAHARRVLEDDGPTDPCEAEPAQRGALARARADRAPLEGRLDDPFAHRRSLPADFPQALATTFGQRRRIGELTERFHGGPDHVVRVVRSDALGEHVGDSRQLHHRPHPAPRDDPRACRGRLEQDGARPEVAGDRVGNRPVDDRDPDHLLLRLLDTLADRLRDFLGLAEPEADAATLVTHHDQRAEAEPSPALHHLGDAVDVHHLLLEFLTPRVRDDAPRTAGRPFLSHLTLSLELEATLARPLGHRADATMVEEAVPVEDHSLDALLLAAAGREQADLLGSGHVARLRQLAPQLGRSGRDGEQRLARGIDDHLGVHVFLAAKDGQPRPLLRTADASAYPGPPANARDELLTGRHQRDAPAAAAALPAFRRICSSAYLTPLPL